MTPDETIDPAEPGDALTGSGAPEPDAAAPGAPAAAAPAEEKKPAEDEAEYVHPEPVVHGHLVEQDNVSEPGVEKTRSINVGDDEPTETSHTTLPTAEPAEDDD